MCTEYHTSTPPCGRRTGRRADPFTTDGEKPWRNRDTEFIDDFPDRAALDLAWQSGWHTLESTLATLTDANLPRPLTIRGEPHTLALALTRSVAQTA